MSRSHASTNPVPSLRMSECERAREVAQLASRLGHPRQEITQAYIGMPRSDGVLSQRSTGEVHAGNAR